MKFITLTSLFVLGMPPLTCSFTVTLKFPTNSAKSRTKLNIINPESLRRDVSQRQGTVNDARVMWVLDCDDQECSMVVGTKAGDRWRFENTAGGAVSTTSQNGHLPTRSSRILMMEMEDTE